MRRMRTVPLKAQVFLIIAVLIFFGVMSLIGCASKPPPPECHYELPVALREVFRGGELTPLTTSDAKELGMPNPFDQVSHTCVSTPIFGLDGRYVRTSVRCW